MKDRAALFFHSEFWMCWFRNKIEVGFGWQMGSNIFMQ